MEAGEHSALPRTLCSISILLHRVAAHARSKFAIDFDEIPQLAEPKVGQASPELYSAMRALRAAAVNKRLDVLRCTLELLVLNSSWGVEG